MLFKCNSFSYFSVVPGCGGVLNVTEAAQTFISPGYPNGYLSNLDCRWVLNSPMGSKVWMNITDIDIESHSSCNYDILRIYGSRYNLKIFRFGEKERILTCISPIL